VRPPADEALDRDKRELREVARARRRAAHMAAGGHAAAAIARLFVAHIPLRAGCAVSGYWPMADELDVRPLMAALAEAGHPLCLPVVAMRARPLIFRAWVPGETLVSGGFGTSIPAPGRPEVTPEVLIVPLLAFDAAGYRLGYGGGFYDRTLAVLKGHEPSVLAVGVAFAGQQVAAVPRGPRDQRLDWLVTETGAVRFR